MQTTCEQKRSRCVPMSCDQTPDRNPEDYDNIREVRIRKRSQHEDEIRSPLALDTEKNISILDVVALEEFYRNCILRNRAKNGWNNCFFSSIFFLLSIETSYPRSVDKKQLWENRIPYIFTWFSAKSVYNVLELINEKWFSLEKNILDVFRIRRYLNDFSDMSFVPILRIASACWKSNEIP